VKEGRKVGKGKQKDGCVFALCVSRNECEKVRATINIGTYTHARTK
jgi:hypothetical protein